MSDPYYSPTEEEIADKARAYRRKFANRFVAIDVHHEALEKLAALEAQNRALRASLTDKECEQICKRMNMRAVHPTLRSAINAVIAARAALAATELKS